MKEIFLKNKFSVFKIAYMSLFLFVLMGRFIGLYWVIPHCVDTALFMFLTLCALSMVAFDLFSEKKLLRVPNINFLIFFIISCCISCVIYIGYGWADNLKALMSIAVSVFFLYSYTAINGMEDVKKLIVLLQKILILFWMIFAIGSLVTFVMQYSNVFYMHGTRIIVGCIENRLFGLFSDPNYASVISIITMVFSVAILNYQNQSKFIRIVCIINLFVQFCYLVLGASRTGEVCFIAVLLMSGFVYSYKINPSKKFSCLMFRILALVCLCISVHFFIEYIRILFSYVPSIFEGAGRSGMNLHQISMERPDVAESTDISNLRFKIWSSAIDIFKTTWLFGASPRNALKYAGDVLPDAFIAKRNYDAHNFYVAIALYTGVSGIICLGTFLIKSAVKMIKYYIVNKFQINDTFFNSLVVSTMCIAVSGMFLSEILFITTVGSFLFWLFLGYISSEVKGKTVIGEEK